MPARASAQSGYKIGISGAATGPASPSYLAAYRGAAHLSQPLNDKGGVNGHKIDFIVLDDKAAPSEAASMPSG